VLNTLAYYKNTALKSFKTFGPGLEHRAMKDTNLFGYFIPKGKTKKTYMELSGLWIFSSSMP
jgi:hypothetical protein